MGGQQIASVGKVIQVQLSYLQFPLAAANAVVLLAVVLVMIAAMTRLVDIRAELLRPCASGRAARRFCVPRRVLRPVRAVPLRADAHHHRAVVPGADRRADLPHARRVHPLVRAALGAASAWWTSGRRSGARCGSGVTVMVLTVLISLPAGYAFRRGFRGASAVFYTAVASLIVPSIIVSLGIGGGVPAARRGHQVARGGPRPRRDRRGLHHQSRAPSPRAWART